MVCVRFLRTQQCDKSQCLLVLDQAALFSGLFGFGFLWQDDSCWDLSVQVWRLLCFWGGCRLALTESLILAQDERWRRA
jgi:hypothetical protein